MPLYEYKCGQCGNTFEKLQKFSDSPVTVCAVCGREGSVERLLSPPAFHLKGGGWYKDGYGSGAPAKSEASGDSTKTDASKGDSTKTDSGKKDAPVESSKATKTEAKPAATSTTTETK